MTHPLAAAAAQARAAIQHLAITPHHGLFIVAATPTTALTVPIHDLDGVLPTPSPDELRRILFVLPHAISTRDPDAVCSFVSRALGPTERRNLHDEIAAAPNHTHVLVAITDGTSGHISGVRLPRRRESEIRPLTKPN